MDLYSENYPELLSERRGDVEQAGREMGEIWTQNVFPHMNVTWNTYTDHIGHPDFSGGCFRGHSGQHSTEDGVTISQSCDNCHNLLAWNEEEPAILKELPSLDR